ncbi:TIGR01440 family protein [Bacillus swezeyi]|uniref:TIGR01440 family protein n=1 Tax=Bacillus swezeyi TaxID=1925020 RepID=UPI002E210BD3|nr:TIGR01440 family protein [Bacillus swezeyi]
MENLEQTWRSILEEFDKEANLRAGQITVIGCSTSEVAGRHIGTSGSEEIAETIYKGLEELQQKTGAALAFQCCEHLNRSLVVEEETAAAWRLPIVFAVPVPKAGGSMASYAYKHMKAPVLVERIEADAGIDIGDTFIGMHLKPVAVPVRVSEKQLGEAHVTLARTRPKLIGGVRAVYEAE